MSTIPEKLEAMERAVAAIQKTLDELNAIQDRPLNHEEERLRDKAAYAIARGKRLIREVRETWELAGKP